MEKTLEVLNELSLNWRTQFSIHYSAANFQRVLCCWITPPSHPQRLWSGNRFHFLMFIVFSVNLFCVQRCMYLIERSKLQPIYFDTFNPPGNGKVFGFFSTLGIYEGCFSPLPCSSFIPLELPLPLQLPWDQIASWTEQEHESTFNAILRCHANTTIPLPHSTKTFHYTTTTATARTIYIYVLYEYLGIFNWLKFWNK